MSTTLTETEPTATDVAAEATLHSFLNCYLLETDRYEVVDAAATPIADLADGAVASVPLTEEGVHLYVPLAYHSPTGRHQFDLPGYYRYEDGDRSELDYVTLATLVANELAARETEADAREELLLRVIRSAHNVERFVDARRDDPALTAVESTFRQSEQSLVFGHHLHPTPKSRQGIPPHEQPTYAPELEGSFSLSYVRADPDLVTEFSTSDRRAAEWVKTALTVDPAVAETFVENHVESDDVLVPVHPWQADYLRAQPRVQEHLGEGIEFLGQVGREFHPTTSVRTLYAPDSPFMVKGSLSVKITNATRENKPAELKRGVAISELFDTQLGADLADRFPDFHVIRDPAALTLDLGDGEASGFEVVLRENPWVGEEPDVAPIVSLCQDGIDGPSRLEAIVRTLAERGGRSTAAVSEDWFRRYLEHCIRPFLWLYLERGVGVEAHQQNSVLSLDGGYPDGFYYRDNQGYYLPESKYDEVDALLPGVGERARSVGPDWIADERLRYYVVCNNAFGVINAFGTADLIDERDLLSLLREELLDARRWDHEGSTFLDVALEESTIPCKGNLLTRFRGMDELTAPIENQSVYVEVDNPLVTELPGDRT